MRRWWWVAVLFLSVGLNIGLLVGGATRRSEPPTRPEIDRQQPLPPDVPAGPPREALLRIADRMGLQGSERDRFIQLNKEFFRRTRTIRSELERTRQELKRELTGEEPSRERVEELLERSGRLQVEMERVFARHVLEGREMLDGEAEQIYIHFLGRLGRAARGDPGSAMRGPPGRRRRP